MHIIWSLGFPRIFDFICLSFKYFSMCIPMEIYRNRTEKIPKTFETIQIQGNLKQQQFFYKYIVWVLFIHILECQYSLQWNIFYSETFYSPIFIFVCYLHYYLLFYIRINWLKSSMNLVPKELKSISWVFFCIISHRNGILRKTYDLERNVVFIVSEMSKFIYSL